MRIACTVRCDFVRNGSEMALLFSSERRREEHFFVISCEAGIQVGCPLRLAFVHLMNSVLVLCPLSCKLGRFFFMCKYVAMCLASMHVVSINATLSLWCVKYPCLGQGAHLPVQ